MYSPFSLYLRSLSNQALQLTYFIDERLKVATKDAEWEKALKDVTVATAKDQNKAIKVVEKKAQASEKARALVEKRRTAMENKLKGTELKLAKVESLNLAQADEIVDLKAALEAYEKKWYNEGFVDAENSAEPVIYQAQRRMGGWPPC